MKMGARTKGIVAPKRSFKGTGGKTAEGQGHGAMVTGRKQQPGRQMKMSPGKNY